MTFARRSNFRTILPRPSLPGPSTSTALNPPSTLTPRVSSDSSSNHSSPKDLDEDDDCSNSHLFSLSLAESATQDRIESADTEDPQEDALQDLLDQLAALNIQTENETPT